MIFKGIAVYPGIGVAKCMILKDAEPCDMDAKSIGDFCKAKEKGKVEGAIEKAIFQIGTIKNGAQAKDKVDQVEMMEAQVMLLQDPSLINAIHKKIESEGLTAVGAIQKTINEQTRKFESLDDVYFRERAQDVCDIGRRLSNIVLGIEETDIANLKEDVILVGKNITPSQMVSLDREKIRGIVSESGGKTSHTAILANNMEIPAVFGCCGISLDLNDNGLIAVDGTSGLVITEITKEQETSLRSDIEKLAKLRLELKEMADKKTLTKDGAAVSLCANILMPEDTTRVLEVGADGVGLFRTEFLFMDRKSAPSEEEQYIAYKKVIEAMKGKPVTIRTMDIGGDKEISYLNLPKEENPFIGYRAIRICLDHHKLFKTQLRAILRASVHGQALIMYPMISCIEEIRAAKAILNEVREELRREGEKFDEQILVGIMIEIPSAAVMADILIKEADFFSIGTNDLTQYTLAVDRMNEKLSGLYNPFQPGVLRLVQRAISTAKEAGGTKFSAMCGELAADPIATILLLGMGLNEFSVNPAALLKIRKLISLIDKRDAKEIAEKAMLFSTAAEVENYLRKVTTEMMGERLL